MSEDTSLRRTGRLIGILVLVLLAAAACGGDEGAVVGADAPDFELPEAAGGTVSLDDYAGRPVLLYFHMAEG